MSAESRTPSALLSSWSVWDILAGAGLLLIVVFGGMVIFAFLMDDFR